MTEQERKERFATAIVGLFESYRQKASDALLRIWFQALGDIPPDVLDAAVVQAIQKLKFMPTVAELRELAGTGGGSFEAMAERAWQQFTEAVRRLGPDKSVNFQDGVINAVIRHHGGWQRVCDLPRDEFDKWLRKDFIATYVRLCRDGCPEELRRYHAGHYEIENTRWIGRTLPNGGTYRLGMFGSEVVAVEANGYQPALPAPEPQQRLAASAAGEFGADIKRISQQ